MSAPRPALFTGKVKDSSHRVQGILTNLGISSFETLRAKLALYSARHVSDADVIEYACRRVVEEPVEDWCDRNCG